jgi:hypothetical protein
LVPNCFVSNQHHMVEEKDKTVRYQVRTFILMVRKMILLNNLRVCHEAILMCLDAEQKYEDICVFKF